MGTHARLTALATAAAAATAVAGLAQAGAAGGATASDRDAIVAAAIASAKSHPGATRFGPDQALTAVDTIVDANGASHVRLRRTYRGLEVVGGDLVVHQGRAKAWKGSSQTLDKDLTLSTTPLVAQPESGTLVVDATGATPRLAWRTVSGCVKPDGTPSRLETYVDARTGAVIRTVQRIQTADGSGQSLYSGAVPLQLTLSGSSYQLKDPTRGNTYTTDMGNTTDGLFCQLFGSGCKVGTLFTSPDASFGNGSTSSRESAAVDAQYGTNTTWDFYRTTFGRNGIFGNGSGSYNRVHYGSKYNNAFWDGTKMTYGDGDGTNYGPLTSLDVAGHEMSHGVTQNTANLTYSGESGGLNESTSDIFGTMVEFYAANPNDLGDYLIGEEFDIKSHLGFRRMDNPAADGSSASCWTTGTKNLEVHSSSGVGNHFFYLLSEGSGAKSFNGVSYDSPTCNGSTVTGIGRAAAGAIWYRALTVYMTSGTNYSGARVATLNAARDLYGAGSTQYDAVASAWSAVSVA